MGFGSEFICLFVFLDGHCTRCIVVETRLLHFRLISAQTHRRIVNGGASRRWRLHKRGKSDTEKVQLLFLAPKKGLNPRLKAAAFAPRFKEHSAL